MSLQLLQEYPKPSVSSERDLEFWMAKVWQILKLVGSGTVNPGLIAAGAVATATITVKGAKAGMTADAGPPATLEAGLLWSAFVTAADTVTVRLYNSTGGGITPASATWNARVMP